MFGGACHRIVRTGLLARSSTVPCKHADVASIRMSLRHTISSASTTVHDSGMAVQHGCTSADWIRMAGTRIVVERSHGRPAAVSSTALVRATYREKSSKAM